MGEKIFSPIYFFVPSSGGVAGRLGLTGRVYSRHIFIYKKEKE
jgi:hypothetical protein